MPRKDLDIHLPPRLLSLSGAAEVLGVSVHTLRLWVRQGKMPVVRLDNALRIDMRDLETVIMGAKGFWAPDDMRANQARKGHASRRARKQTGTKAKTAGIGTE